VREVKPIWTSASFLVYTGGLIVLLSAVATLVYLSVLYGSAAQVGWGFLVLVVLYVIAHALRLRDRPIAAGIFALASVIAWGAFVVLLFTWFGWDGFRPLSEIPLHHWSWSRLALWLLILAAALDDHRRFRFPLIRLVSVVVTYFFVIDLITSGGNWTAVVTLLVGLVYLVAGVVGRQPSAFWLHVVAGVLIGGSLLYWLSSSDVEWAFLGVFATLFIAYGARVRRSSWAVIGTLGLILIAYRYSIVWTLPSGGGGSAFFNPQRSTFGGSQYLDLGLRPWAPIVTFAVLGFVLVAFGLLARRRRAAAVAAPPPQ
jgi:hypothetical protein